MPKSGRRSNSKPVIWSDQAETDLKKIFDHIADNFSPQLAIEVSDRIIDEIGSLSLFPRKGAMSPRFNEIRELIVDGNTIYYRNNESEVVIASIRPRRMAIKNKP
jgi:plasmid stabilization system protein ParE